MNAIEISHLRRVFKSHIGVIKRTTEEIITVDDVSFDIHEGELFGLLGPNGAGKTTTTKMLTTLLIPTDGFATVKGFDVVKQAEEVRKRIGFIFGGERGLYWRLSVLDNLRYFASLYGINPDVSKKRIAYLMELVGLNGRDDENVGGYSRGMKQHYGMNWASACCMIFWAICFLPGSKYKQRDVEHWKCSEHFPN